MAVEPTFQIDAKNKNFIVNDIRAIAIRINNLISSRSSGLPNNSEMNADIHKFSMDDANANTVAQIQEVIQNTITEFIHESASVSVRIVDPPEGSLVLRKMMEVTIKLGSEGGIVMNMAQGAGKLVINDLRAV